jgi:hypothetical protein
MAQGGAEPAAEEDNQETHRDLRSRATQDFGAFVSRFAHFLGEFCALYAGSSPTQPQPNPLRIRTLAKSGRVASILLISVRGSRDRGDTHARHDQG